MELTFDACHLGRRLDGGFNRARVCLLALLVTMIRLLKSSSAGRARPFSISRHPMYLGMASILLGITFILGTVVSFVFPVLFVVAMELLFIPHEEEDLERIFGERYREYWGRVRRWV